MKVPWGTSDWRRVLVYGLGASGMAASRLLRSQDVAVVGVDQRAAAALDLGELATDTEVEWLLGADPSELPDSIDGVVLSPGVPMDRPIVQAARANGIPVVAEVELGYLFADGPVIGITGSNGKSTTTAMTGALLREAGFAVEICGNIGIPLSACVSGSAGRIFVTELSSFQLESIDTFRPKAAALLNLSADHLDRYVDDQAYFEAKKALFSNQLSDDVAVVNADDSASGVVEMKSRRRLFSRRRRVEDGCFLDGDIVIEVDPLAGLQQPLFHRRDLALPGLHNLENAMAAALLSRAAGAPASGFGHTLSRFEGLPHRMQRVLDRCGVNWVDDSKATNFAATLKSLEGLADGSVHLILGGRNKGGDAADLSGMARRKVRRAYLIGEAAEEIRAALDGAVTCEAATDMRIAVLAAAGNAVAGETVLLSPACASFDQYRSFAERGSHFQDLVRAIDG